MSSLKPLRGYISIDIPTKTYIKSYIQNIYGDQPVMQKTDSIGSKFYDLLQHKTNERKTEYSNARYKENIRLYVSFRTFRRRGCNLNETNIMYFNSFLEDEIKSRFYFMMDFFISILPSFEANLPAVRKELGIDIEGWADDSMKKDYYRYRLKTKKSLLYKKPLSRIHTPASEIEPSTKFSSVASRDSKRKLL